MTHNNRLKAQEKQTTKHLFLNVNVGLKSSENSLEKTPKLHSGNSNPSSYVMERQKCYSFIVKTLVTGRLQPTC